LRALPSLLLLSVALAAALFVFLLRKKFQLNGWTIAGLWTSLFVAAWNAPLPIFLSDRGKIYCGAVGTRTQYCANFRVKPNAPEPKLRPVWVVSHGYHATLAVPSLDFVVREPALAPTVFGRGPFVEVGWGEREFFMADGAPDLSFLKAFYQPRPAVLHVAAIAHPTSFQRAEIVEVRLSEAGFERLLDAVIGHFAETVPLRHGLYGDSEFYRSKKTYQLPTTCNTFVAKMLRTGGLPIDQRFAASTFTLMRQVREFRYSE
jgi:hypothetical protein